MKLIPESSMQRRLQSNNIKEAERDLMAKRDFERSQVYQNRRLRELDELKVAQVKALVDIDKSFLPMPIGLQASQIYIPQTQKQPQQQSKINLPSKLDFPQTKQQITNQKSGRTLEYSNRTLEAQLDDQSVTKSMYVSNEQLKHQIVQNSFQTQHYLQSPNIPQLPAKEDYHDCAICRKKNLESQQRTVQKTKSQYDINKIILQARILLDEDRLPEAQKYIEQYVDLFQHSDLYYLYGDVLRQVGIYEESEHFLLEALKFRYYSPQTLISLGKVYMNMGQYVKSQIVFKKSLAIEESAQLHHLLALSLLQQKQYLEAALHLTKAIEIDAHQYDYYLTRGMIYQKLQYLELAMNDFLVYKHLHPYYKQDLGQQVIDAELSNDFEMAARLKNLSEVLEGLK